MTDKIEITLLETKEVTFDSAQLNLLQEFHWQKVEDALTVICLCCDWFLKKVLDIKGCVGNILQGS